jgi:hypothetical protein
MRGLPFLLEAFRRRFSWVSRDAVVVKKCPGSLETLIVMGDRQETSRPAGTGTSSTSAIYLSSEKIKFLVWPPNWLLFLPLQAPPSGAF